MYGNGNTDEPEITDAINSMIDSGMIVVAVSQSVILNKFITKHKHIINGGDMTVETAVTKLWFLLSNVKEKELIFDLFQISLRGEINTDSIVKQKLSEFEHTDLLPSIYERIS
jgi:L-asparaginase/Glu-tRNA(Gln) amidotransferase subunit D